MRNENMIDMLDVNNMATEVVGNTDIHAKLKYEYGNYIIYLKPYPASIGGGYYLEAYTGFGENVHQISKNAANAFCKALADYLASKKEA